jgi:hypothetical protein
MLYLTSILYLAHPIYGKELQLIDKFYSPLKQTLNKAWVNKWKKAKPEKPKERIRVTGFYQYFCLVQLGYLSLFGVGIVGVLLLL